MLTNAGSVQYLRMSMRGQASSFPATWYIALLTAPRSNSDTGATISEPTTGGYARIASPANTSNWSNFSSTSHLTDNLVDLVWTNTGPTAWTITGVALLDSATNGVCWESEDLAVPKTVGANDSYMFNAGDFKKTYN